MAKELEVRVQKRTAELIRASEALRQDAEPHCLQCAAAHSTPDQNIRRKFSEEHKGAVLLVVIGYRRQGDPIDR